MPQDFDAHTCAAHTCARNLRICGYLPLHVMIQSRLCILCDDNIIVLWPFVTSSRADEQEPRVAGVDNVRRDLRVAL